MAIACCGTVSAFDAPSANAPLAYMPALNGASPPVAAGRSTYTRAERVCGSTVGAIMRTLPVRTLPLAAVTSARAPGFNFSSSVAVTSARHSRRPWRIMRNSSVPAPTTEPTVAERDEMMPLSGATTCVYFRRSSCVASCALLDAIRALAVCSAVRYCVICCALMAPVLCSERARCALAAASAAFACASCTAALACARSALTVSFENTASIWPARTTSPTLTRTSVRRKPFDSLPMTASCQAATLPLALSLMGRLAVCGWAEVTVSAGLGALSLLSPALDAGVYRARPAPATTKTAARVMAIGFNVSFFMMVASVFCDRSGRVGGSGGAVPATAGGAVQGYPGGAAVTLQGDDGVFSGQARAARIFQFDQAGQAVLVAVFCRHERQAIPFQCRLCMAAAFFRAAQVEQRFLDLAHGLAHIGAVGQHGFVVARSCRVDLGPAATAVKDRQADGQRADAPGAGRDTCAATAEIAGTDGTRQAQLRVALGLRATHFKAGGSYAAFGVENVGPLAQGLRGQGGNRDGGGRHQRRGCQFLAQRVFGHGRQGYQCLDGDIAAGALVDGAAGAFGGAGAGQRGIGWRFEASPGAQLCQACRIRARGCVLFGDGLQLLAGAQGVILVGHFGGDRDAGVVPHCLRAFIACLGRVACRPVGAENVDFPGSLQCQLRGGTGGLQRLLAGPYHAAVGVQGRRQCGAAGDAVGARLHDAGAGGGDIRTGLLRVGDQFHQQAVALAPPPAGQVRQIAIVRQRRMPLRWCVAACRCWRPLHGAAAQCQQHAGGQRTLDPVHACPFAVLLESFDGAGCRRCRSTSAIASA